MSLRRRNQTVLHHAMRGLSRATDRGTLWFVLAVVLGTRRDKWARRAALRGVASVAIASTTVNLVVMRFAGRTRPDVSLARTGRRPPGVTSFPSGHAASAAAFATGAAIEIPELAAPAGALAGLVAASRVVTRVNSLSDVLAGLALGTAAGLATLRWWPRRLKEPAAAVHPRQHAPAAPDGSGLVLIVNCSAGTASTDLAQSLSASLPEAGIIVATAEDDLGSLLRKASARAQILGVAGGDGSVGVAAGVAMDAGLPLLVVPAGTFNHFAADLGVHSARDALDALAGGDCVRVDTGSADGIPFLNTASTGVYVDLVKACERIEPVLGKWPAVLIALAHVLRTGKPVDLLVDGRRTRVWLLFAGNCRYEPLGSAPAYRPDLADGIFDVRMVDGSQPLARARLIVAVLLGTLGRCRVYRTWPASSVRIASGDGTPVPLCLDGEAAEARSVVRLVKQPRKLLVYRPVTG